TWFVALRRQSEQVAATLPAFAVLFLPVLAAIRVLYPWAAADISPEIAASVHAKSAYLNIPSFIVRAIIYWAVWLGLERALRRASLAQDAGNTPSLERRMRVLCAVGIIAVGLTMTFAAFDWMMSLSPTWYSTVFGVDFFAGAMVGALALLAVLVARGRRTGELPESIGVEHLHALAKVILTFVLFWLYIGFSQFIVIWSGEIPVETSWYVPRTRGGWAILAWVVIIGQFGLPFCALVVRSLKRNVAFMTLLGIWLLVMHYLDCYWTVMPDASRLAMHGFAGYVMDFGALLLVAGVGSLMWSARRLGEPAVPRGDPELSASLDYSTSASL
ncbi:MAG TPA: hypothetical protein VHQ23_00245, partial [Ilumatobacteraceae bacterium]|nr:hypothetical protein [Ilumatobacteraceae bacterium]